MKTRYLSIILIVLALLTMAQECSSGGEGNEPDSHHDWLFSHRYRSQERPTPVASRAPEPAQSQRDNSRVPRRTCFLCQWLRPRRGVRAIEGERQSRVGPGGLA